MWKAEWVLPRSCRLNLTVRPNCLTTRVLFEGKRAVAVEGEQIALSFGEFVSISAGINHSCGLKSDRSIACCGSLWIVIPAR